MHVAVVDQPAFAGVGIAAAGEGGHAPVNPPNRGQGKPLEPSGSSGRSSRARRTNGEAPCIIRVSCNNRDEQGKTDKTGFFLIRFETREM
jgi:hypothetical protein